MSKRFVHWKLIKKKVNGLNKNVESPYSVAVVAVMVLMIV